MDVQKVELGRQSEGQARWSWITVTAGVEVTNYVTIRRVCKISKEGVKVHAPKYQKLKDEGCVGVMGNPDTSCENFVNIQPGSEPIMSNS